jgi:DNA-binding MarR family transcriptional regulator
MVRTEWRVLFHLGLHGEMTAVEIGRRARIHKTKISRAVQRLEERAFLVRRRDGADRRVEHLTLTSEGQAAYADLARVAQDYNARLKAHLTPQEAAHLRSALLKLARG